MSFLRLSNVPLPRRSQQFKFRPQHGIARVIVLLRNRECVLHQAVSRPKQLMCPPADLEMFCASIRCLFCVCSEEQTCIRSWVAACELSRSNPDQSDVFIYRGSRRWALQVRSCHWSARSAFIFHVFSFFLLYSSHVRFILHVR